MTVIGISSSSVSARKMDFFSTRSSRYLTLLKLKKWNSLFRVNFSFHLYRCNLRNSFLKSSMVNSYACDRGSLDFWKEERLLFLFLCMSGYLQLLRLWSSSLIYLEYCQLRVYPRWSKRCLQLLFGHSVLWVHPGTVSSQPSGTNLQLGMVQVSSPSGGNNNFNSARIFLP